LAIRGFVLAKTGWKLDYINRLPEDHLLFAYHYLRKADEDYWNNFGRHLGTLWDLDSLRQLQTAPEGVSGQNSLVFVPLSLVVDPQLPEHLLGKTEKSTQTQQSSSSMPRGDGLHTGMALPSDTEVINMAELSKAEFLSLIGNSGLKVRK